MSAANYAAAGLGPTLVPAEIIPPHFGGLLLLPDPPVGRPLTAYTRTRPDPIAAAFIDILATEALITPAHVRRRLGRGGATMMTVSDMSLGSQTVLSIASRGSILSIGSAGSVLSVGRSGLPCRSAAWDDPVGLLGRVGSVRRLGAVSRVALVAAELRR